MKNSTYAHLFKPLTIKGLRLKNRITMAPLYLGYAAAGKIIEGELNEQVSELIRLLRDEAHAV